MPWEYRFRVGMSSVDAAGVMFYPELFRFAHDAYEALMAEIGHDLPGILAGGRYLLPLVRAEADYLRPMRHGVGARVAIDLARLGDTSFTLRYLFRIEGADDGSGMECARVQTVHVCLDRTTKRPIPLPDELRQALGRISS